MAVFGRELARFLPIPFAQVISMRHVDLRKNLRDVLEAGDKPPRYGFEDEVVARLQRPISTALVEITKTENETT